MIKNIVFDMGNVLLSYAPQNYIKTIITDENIADAVLRELFCNEEWIQLDAGSITEEEAVTCVQSRIPQYAEHVQKAMDNWHSHLAPIEGMPQLVEALKEKGYKIYLLSNANMRFFKYQSDIEMFKMFDGFLISANERLLKPEMAIYERLLSKFDLKADECVFIDDIPANVEGAQSAGIMAHQFVGAEDLTEYFKEKGIL